MFANEPDKAFAFSAVQYLHLSPTSYQLVVAPVGMVHTKIVKGESPARMDDKLRPLCVAARFHERKSNAPAFASS